MAIVRVTEGEPVRMTPEMEARLSALEGILDDDIDYSEIPEWTEDDWATSIRISDYPSIEEAKRVATRLCEMRRAGKSIEEMESYRASQVKHLASV